MGQYKTLNNFAAEFSSSNSYAVDDLVMYLGELYKCTSTHTGAWNATHFTKTSVATEISSAGETGSDTIIDGSALDGTITINGLITLIENTLGSGATTNGVNVLVQFPERISVTSPDVKTLELGLCLVRLKNNYSTYYSIVIENASFRYSGTAVAATTLLVNLEKTEKYYAEGNPDMTGQTPSTLTGLKIGANYYDVPTGSSSVEANPTIPSGTTPTTLSNLKIGTNYYDIPNIIDATSLGSTSTISDLVNLINYTNGDLTTLIQFKEIISYSTGTKVLGVCLVHIEHNYLNYYTININNGFHQYLGNNIPDTTLLVDLPSVVNMENPMTNACDIIVGGSSGTPTRLAKGTAGQVLTINSNADGVEWANAQGGGGSSKKILSTRARKKIKSWIKKTWSGVTTFKGDGVWTDGENIYYSSGSYQYVLDKSTSTWSAKTWNGLTNFSGNSVWTDGENIYHSASSYQYVLDKATSTWSAKTWSGLTNFNSNGIWTDGENIYCTKMTGGGGSPTVYSHYVLDKATSTWSAKTWSGFTDFSGDSVWTDGVNIYVSAGSDQYVLDIATSTWSAKTWSGLTNFYGYNIWTDGENIYCSNYNSQYVLDKSTSTWSAKTWSGLTGVSFEYSRIWTDGENIYYSDYTGGPGMGPVQLYHYVLVEKQAIL